MTSPKYPSPPYRSSSDQPPSDQEPPFEPFEAAIADAAPTAGFCAALILAADPHGRALCQLRDDREDVFAPGLWGCFGGAVDPGETRREAARREWREEIGAEAPLTAFAPAVRLWTPEDREICFFAVTAAPAPAEISLREGAGFGFLTPAQIESYPFIPYVRSILRAFLAQEDPCAPFRFRG